MPLSLTDAEIEMLRGDYRAIAREWAEVADIRRQRKFDPG
jgi:hypothetical protein